MVIAWFSCGATSAVACKIATMQYTDVRIIYIDTGGEHPDSERFRKDCERWIGHHIEVVRNPRYADHFHCLEAHGWGAHGASCTLELKKRMRWKIEDECPDYEAQVFGFDSSETLRAKRFSEQYPKAKPVYPLMDRGLSKSECLAIIERAGITLPKMYRLGYHNNNCVGCLKGGLGYWNKIRKDFPDAFSRMALIERQRGFASHKERDGTPIYLDQLDPNRGHHQSEIIPECGLFCDLEAMDII